MEWVDGMPYVFLGRTGEADESGGGGGRGPRISFLSVLAGLHIVQGRTVWRSTKRIKASIEERLRYLNWW